MAERLVPPQENQVSTEKLFQTELPLVVMRPISTLALVRRWKQHRDMSKIALIQVLCAENTRNHVFPKVTVTLEPDSNLKGNKISDKKTLTSQLNAVGLYAVSDEEFIDNNGQCLGVIAPPLYYSKGENTKNDFFADSSDVHTREKELEAGPEKTSQNAAVNLIRSEEIFRHYQLVDKIFALLPVDLQQNGAVSSQYQKLVAAYDNEDSALFHQAYGGFMNTLRSAARNIPHFMSETLANAWDEILLEEQLKKYLRNPVQAPMLIAQLPVHEFSDAMRDKLLEHPNAADIQRVFEYVDMAMKPNLTAIMSRLPAEIQEVFKPELNTPGLLPGELLRKRIKVYLDLKLRESYLAKQSPDLLVAFRSWKEHIEHSLQVFGDKVDKIAFGEHVQNMHELFEISPTDTAVPRHYMKQFSRVSQPDEAIIAAWGLNQYDGTEYTPEETINNRQLLFTFPQGLHIERNYREKTTVSSYPWRRVFAVTMQKGAKDFANSPENVYEGFKVQNTDHKGVGLAERKADIGSISLERHELPITYDGRPIKFLVTVRNKRDTSHFRKVLERGELDVKDYYANSIIVDSSGPEFADLTEAQRIEFGIQVGDFFDAAMKHTAKEMQLQYDREEQKDSRRTAKPTGGSGASAGGYRVMKYYAVVDWQHDLAGGPDTASEETVRMEVCHYPTKKEYERKIQGEPGVLGDEEYATKRWFTSASDSTVPLIDLFAPKKNFQRYKHQKNGNGKTEQQGKYA